MRQIIMLLLAFVFGLAATVLTFAPADFTINRQRISVLFTFAFFSALWGVFHRCKCCKKENGKILNFYNQKKEKK